MDVKQSQGAATSTGRSEASRLPWRSCEGAGEIIADRSRAFTKLRFFETAAVHQRVSMIFGSAHEMLPVPQQTPGRIAQAAAFAHEPACRTSALLSSSAESARLHFGQGAGTRACHPFDGNRDRVGFIRRAPRYMPNQASTLP
jgi:hypothetical protein